MTVGDRPSFRLRRGRVKGFAGERMARQLGVDARAASTRMVQRLEHEHACALADVHARAAASERAARLRIHQPQEVESGEGQARERVGAAGQHHIGTAMTYRLDAAPDRDRARRAGRDDAAARTLESERAATASTGVLRK